MAEIFSQIVMNLVSMGFLNFLIFLLVLAVMFSILRKSKILGESPIVDGIVSFAIAFMVFAYPIITGISLSTPMATFFTQAFVILLIFLFGFLVASPFYPNLSQWLPKVFTSRNALWSMIALALALFVTSGLVSVIYSGSMGSEGSRQTASRDVLVIVAGLVILVVVLLISTSARG